jgi:hypothetical protein
MIDMRETRTYSTFFTLPANNPTTSEEPSPPPSLEVYSSDDAP